MTWITKFYCVSCEEELSDHARMYSHGRCPQCGYKSEFAGTIVDTYEKAAKWVRTAPWWKFWGEQGYWEFKEGDSKCFSG